MKKIENFIKRNNHIINDTQYKFIHQKESSNLLFEIINIEKDNDEYLLNDFDTPSVIKNLFKLIDIANINYNNCRVLSRIYDYIVNMLDMFGMNMKLILDEETDNGIKYLSIIKKFRENIRQYAKQHKQSELFVMTDELRKELDDIGMALTDR